MASDAYDMEEAIERMRALCASHRRVLQALAGGAQLVLHYGRWEAFAEQDGKVRPLGVAVDDATLRVLLRQVPLGHVAVVRSEPEFVYLPAKHRALFQDLLTLSMPTQHLVVRQAERPESPAPRERLAA